MVYRRDVRQERKSQRRLGRQVFRDALQVLARHDHGDFAAKFEHFRDSLTVPLFEFMHYRAFIGVLCLHYEFVS